MKKLIINQTTQENATTLSEFIKVVFDDAVASYYSEQGNAEFYKYIEPSAIIERLTTNHWILTTKVGNKLLGIIEIRSNNHLAMLFVDSNHQRQGIGKHLLAAAIKQARHNNPELKKPTVHSSPNSVSAYKKLGFTTTASEKDDEGNLAHMSKKLMLLVVCSRNQKRSLTAEKIYKNDPLKEVRSVGTSPNARRQITQADVDWAETILCMEQKQQEILQQLFGKNNLPTIRVLDIADDYEYMDAELVQMLEQENYNRKLFSPLAYC
ncbi:MAG: GNAT family N-acetyltransferase [Candidatus Pacebacteria bacterium]|nr:GNAT family N-acetyltransferase [Candidatus Paceibacterota bacterium]